jgi:two-component system NtrC family sensor kinase
MGGRVLRVATILVVDDEKTIRRVMGRLLEAFGHEPILFASAQAALDEVDFGRIDLVISDLQMPMPGDVFAQALKKRGIDIPVIILTGDLDEDKTEWLKSLGIAGILAKPFATNDLRSEIDRLI